MATQSDVGADPAFVADAIEPVPVSPLAGVNPGEWVLYRSGYDRIRVYIAQVDKITPKLVKFAGPYWPRQCAILSVVAAFPTQEIAEQVKQAIAGVDGEFSRRRRAADDERSRRVTEALTAANRSVEAIIAKAKVQAWPAPALQSRKH